MISLDYTQFLVCFSAFLSILGATAYIKDTFKGRTKPNRVSWFLWGTIPLIGTVAALEAHADPWATVRIFLAGFLPLIVFIASFFNKKSYWKLTYFDWICLILAIVATIFWAILQEPKMAILLAVVADAVASFPTIIKAWKNPETETGSTYLIGFIAAILVTPSIPVWNIENSAFQVYLILVNFVLMSCVYRKHII